MVALEKGAEVFRNVCCTGEVDLVLKINGQFIPIDVKLKTWKKRDRCFCAAHGDRLGKSVWGVGINPQTRTVSWYRKRHEPKTFQCPPGLEDFWK